MPGSFDKSPDESFAVGIEFVNRLPAGASLVSGTVEAIDLQSGSDVSSSILGATTAAISGSVASVRVLGGADGKKYKICFEVSLDNSDKLEDSLVMRVAEC